MVGGARCAPSLIIPSLLMLLLLICYTGLAIEENPSELSASSTTTNTTTDNKIEQGEGVGDGEAAKVSEEKGVIGDGIEKLTVESGGETGQGSSDSKVMDSLNSRVDECDPSIRCFNESSKLVACLRVPGMDSSALSLLIQNKGTQSLTLNISAPDFVKLEQIEVILEGKEDKEIKVVLEEGSNGTEIILKAGQEHCSLSLMNLIPENKKKTEPATFSRYLSLSRRSSYVYALLPVAGVAAAVWIYFRFRWQESSSPRYQKAEVEVALPVSSNSGKETSTVTNSWDSDWGDGWADEEAPAMPSRLSLTPSSKGLASRKLNKDGWKD